MYASADVERVRRVRPPEIRGRYMQTFLDAVEDLPAADVRAIREEMTEAVWRQIRDVNAFGWLPIEVNLVATHALVNRLGPRRSDEFFKQLLFTTWQTPLLRGLISAVLRVVGRDPTGYLAWIGKGFDLMFRNCGTWRVIEKDKLGRAIVEVVGLPPQYAEDRIWLQSVASALSALFLLARCEGAVSFRVSESGEGNAIYQLRWTPPQ